MSVCEIQAKKARDAKKEQEKELNDLFKAVITVPKVRSSCEAI